MVQFLIRTTTCLAALLAAYSVYAYLAVPLLTPPLQEPDLVTGASEPQSADQRITEFLPLDGWERQQAHELRFDGGILLFQEFTPTDDGRLILKPCTFIYDFQSSGKQRPIILRSNLGAELDFGDEMDFGRSKMGKLESGRLSGEIKIYVPESSPEKNDAIEIRTANVQINRGRIWTPSEVSFQMGPHQGQGRDLTVHLISDDALLSEEERERQDQLLSGVRSLELLHVDWLRFTLPGQTLFERGDSAAGVRADPVVVNPPEATQAELRCEGPFQIDFLNQVATLEEQIHLQTLNPVGPRDQLQCQWLALEYGEAKAESKPRRKAGSKDASGQLVAPVKNRSAASIAFKQLTAVGAPIKLNAPSRECSAECERLTYDFQSQRLTVEGTRPAWGRVAGDFIMSPRISYQFPEDKQRLGQWMADGPGRFERRQDSKRVAMTWQRQIHLQKQGEGHVLSILGAARFSDSELGEFQADTLHVWLLEVLDPRPNRTLADANPRANNLPAAPEQTDAKDVAAGKEALARNAKRPQTKLVPSKLLATGNVQARSPQLTGNTERLEAWFERGQAATPSSREPVSLSRADPKTKNAPPSSAAKPLVLQGRLIRLQVSGVDSVPDLQEASVEGNVQLDYETAANPPQRVHISGNRLHLQRSSSGGFNASITGPETVAELSGVRLSGTNFHLVQGQSRFWMNGPGTMAVDPTSPTATARRVNLPTNLQWSQRLHFDGQVIKVEGDVRVRGGHLLKNNDRVNFTLRGPQLDAVLTQPLDFQDPDRRTAVDLSSLTFRGQVSFENYTFDPQGRQTSFDRGELRDMSLNQLNNEFTAGGPGWIKSVRMQAAHTGLLDGNSSAVDRSRSRAPSRQQESTELVYFYVNYRAGIRGNLARKEIQLNDVPQLVYGPVPDWTSELNPLDVSSLGPEGVMLSCAQLSLADMSALGIKSMEMSALGNVQVTGQAFQALANRLSYSSGKGRLDLQGDARNQVRLYYQKTPGAPRSELTSRNVTYWPQTGEVEIHDGGALQIK